MHLTPFREHVCSHCEALVDQARHRFSTGEIVADWLSQDGKKFC